MNTFYYIAYIRKDQEAADEIGCVKEGGKDREYFHKLLDEFLDNRNNPGNEADEETTCFKLTLCNEKHGA